MAKGTTQKPERKDWRQDVTNTIVEMMEKGVAPWQKPWSNSMQMPFNGATGRPYSGGNALYLMALSDARGHNDPRWLTYNQSQEKGWQVRRGEKGVQVEFWQFDKVEKVKGQDGTMQEVRVKLDPPMQRLYTVFNASQMDGVPALERIQRTEFEVNQLAERVLKNSGAKIIHGGDRAYFQPSTDEIHMPPKERFESEGAYYGTAMHELGHWTGHESRMNRDGITGQHAFGSVGYAKEELRAELASVFLQQETGIQHDTQRHAAYLENWLTVLKKDKNELFRAAREATNIADFVVSLDQQKEQEQAVEELQANALPPRGTAAYSAMLRSDIEERNANGNYHVLDAAVKAKLGQGAEFGMLASDEGFSGKVIAETKHSIAIQLKSGQAVGLHKIDLRALPEVGQEVDFSPNSPEGREVKISRVQENAKTNAQARHVELESTALSPSQAASMKNAATHKETEMEANQQGLTSIDKAKAMQATDKGNMTDQRQALDSASRVRHSIESVADLISQNQAVAKGLVVGIPEIASVAYIDKASGDLTLKARDQNAMRALSEKVKEAGQVDLMPVTSDSLTFDNSTGDAAGLAAQTLRNYGANAKSIAEVSALVQTPAQQKAKLKESAEILQFEAKELMGQNAKAHEPQPLEGNYKGKIVGQSLYHVMQQVSGTHAVLHAKDSFDGNVPQLGQHVQVKYEKGQANSRAVKPQVKPKDKALER